MRPESRRGRRKILWRMGHADSLAEFVESTRSRQCASVTHNERFNQRTATMIKRIDDKVTLARLTVIAALAFMALRPAQAQEMWEANQHRCIVTKNFSEGEMIAPGGYFLRDGKVTIAIGPDEIPELEKAIHNRKICDKFYTCVAWRDGYDLRAGYPGPPLPRGKARPKRCPNSMLKAWKD